MDNTRRRKSGLTLVEVLATIVLLGLVAAAFLESFGGVTERARARALVRDLVQLDARARLHARTGATVAVAVDPAKERVVAVARPSGKILAQVQWPEGSEVALFADGAARAKAVTIEAGGSSVDYSFDVKGIAGTTRIDVSGLTGWTTTASVSEGAR